MASSGGLEEPDLFASLGGSLMKELLADLNDEGDAGGWLSLEELEQELAHLDQEKQRQPPLPLPLPNHNTAASMVVHAQQQLYGPNMITNATTTTTSAVDAWSLSLEKFTAASLEEDFLQADSARKQQQQQQQSSTITGPPPGLLAQAEDYNLAEPLRVVLPSSSSTTTTARSAGAGGVLAPPPGMGGGLPEPKPETKPPPARVDSIHEDQPESEEQAMAAFAEQLKKTIGIQQPLHEMSQGLLIAPPVPSRDPVTPHNSLSFNFPAKLPPATPSNSLSVDLGGTVRVKPVPVGPPEGPTATATAVTSSLVTPPPGTSGPPPGVSAPPPPRGPPPATGGSGPASSMPYPMVGAPILGIPVVMGPPPIPNAAATAPPPPPATARGPPPEPPRPTHRAAAGVPPQPTPPRGGLWPGGSPPNMAVPPQFLVPPQPTLRRPVYANPLPNVPSVPASQLQSKFMPTRDISFVVHAILKPILLQQQQQQHVLQYDRLFWQRARGGPVVVGPPPPSLGTVRPTTTTTSAAAPSTSETKDQGNENNTNDTTEDENMDALEAEMKSREQKTKDWSSEHHVLGHVSKSSVTRPRALIAQPVVGTDSGSGGTSESRQQRQALWKARIYCDQAYQAYLQVTWPNQGTAAAAAWIKLLKCLGMTASRGNSSTTAANNKNSADDDDDAGDTPVQPTTSGPDSSTYTITNELALPLLLKLPKGRVLLARLLEQALLPPAAVAVLLPNALKALYDLKPPGSSSSTTMVQEFQMVDNRVFGAWTRVLQTLPPPVLDGPLHLLPAIRAVQAQAEVALSTTIRMQMVHALLHRATMAATIHQPQRFGDLWKAAEAEFMTILAG